MHVSEGNIFDKGGTIALWMERGNCSGMNPDDFFPERGDNRGIREAKLICQGCEVQTDCLEYALTSPYEKWGIWGGYSERERRRIRLGRSVRAKSA